MGKVEVKNDLVATGQPLTLADVRELVEACGGMAEESRVTVRHSGDQRDGDWGRITVHGEARK